MIHALADCFKAVKEAYEACDEGTELMVIIEDLQDGIADTPEGKKFCKCLEEMIRNAGIITENIIRPEDCSVRKKVF